MPTQAKKIASTQHTEKSTKLKKKKKKESNKITSRKDSNSGSDSTTEGQNKKSKTKVIAFGRSTVLLSDTGSYPRSSSQEQDLISSCRACSSTDGRSTSSSGENLESPFTNSSSDIDCSRAGEERDSSATSSMIVKTLNESLRWEGKLEDIREEEDRIRVYKINRRKSEISFELFGDEWNHSCNYDQGLGFDQKSLPEIAQRTPTTPRVYCDGLCLYVREPRRIYSYEYTCREKARHLFISEIRMYPKMLAKKFITAVVCYPIFNNGIFGPEYSRFKDCVCIVPKNHDRVVSSKVIKEKMKIERHKCGLNFQPKQRVQIYSSSLFLVPK